MRAHLRQLALAILAGCLACAGAAGGRRARVDPSVLTQEQLAERHYENLLEAVQMLRSNWLNDRGPDSFTAPSHIWVYLDNTRMGGVQSLAQISTRYVSSVRKLNGIDATARWGIGHGAGVIAVMSWPPQENPELLAPSSRPDTAAVPDSTAGRPH
ncbi:MAG: hypothetical protein ACJ79A_18340 [Gemmatimonadaceae bacterium]